MGLSDLVTHEHHQRAIAFKRGKVSKTDVCVALRSNSLEWVYPALIACLRASATEESWDQENGYEKFACPEDLRREAQLVLMLKGLDLGIDARSRAVFMSLNNLPELSCHERLDLEIELEELRSRQV